MNDKTANHCAGSRADNSTNGVEIDRFGGNLLNSCRWPALELTPEIYLIFTRGFDTDTVQLHAFALD